MLHFLFISLIEKIFNLFDLLKIKIVDEPPDNHEHDTPCDDHPVWLFMNPFNSVILIIRNMPIFTFISHLIYGFIPEPLTFTEIKTKICNELHFCMEGIFL